MAKVLSIPLVLFLAMPVFAQSRFTGRWSTDPQPQGWSGWDAEGGLKVFKSGPPLAQTPTPKKGGTFPNGLLLDLKVEGNSVSGFLGEDGLWGSPLKIELGTIEGQSVRFLTTRNLDGREPIIYQWIAELSNDNTMVLRGGNIAGGRGGEGRPLQPGREVPRPPTALPPLSRSSFLAGQTLRRVN